MSIPVNKTAAAWGRLLRLPNLFTVPGDVIAGALWAGTGAFALKTVWSSLGILFVYSAGLLFNDYFDRHTDTSERPDRPIPSGNVSAGAVSAAAWASLAAGNLIVFAGGGVKAGAACSLLSVCVLLYDAGFKKNRTAGPVLMGLCRGGSVTVGALTAGAVFFPFPAAAAGVTGLYIVCVTFLAADETKERVPGPEVFLPVLVIAGGMVFALLKFPFSAVFFLGLIVFAAAGVESAWAAYKTETGLMPVPPFIGRSLRILIVLQAAWAAFALHNEPILTVLGTVVCFGILRACAELSSRKFYGS